MKHKPHLLLFAALLTGPAMANTEPPGLATSFGQMVLGLGAVIALLLASLWLIKRLSSPRGAASGLKLIGGVAVGSRERVMLVEIGDKVLVLGVTSASVNTLHVLDASQLPRTPPPPVPGTSGDFSKWLSKSLERRRDEG